MAASPTRRTILCPLEIEAKGLRRADLPGHIVVCGPGESAIENTVRELFEQSGPCHLVLAGLAGGLEATIRPGDAHWISHVLDLEGNLIARSPQRAEGAGKSICTVQTAVETASAKRSLHQATGADLVDMESQRFVEVCVELGIAWEILRGVSDEANHDLPPGSLDLVDSRGKPRMRKVIRYLACNPLRILSLMKLARRASRAMKHVAIELKRDSSQ